MKQFITPQDLRLDSFRLASKIDYDPDFLVAIWRGGAPIGCYIHEFLKKCGNAPDHIAIRTSRYTGIDESSQTQVYNLGYLLERLNFDSKVLLVDDVYDTGLTIQAIKKTLSDELKEKCPKDIRVATVYFKPKRNKTLEMPDYYLYETDNWLVFPHELEGLTFEEIFEHVNPETAYILDNKRLFLENQKLKKEQERLINELNSIFKS